MTRNAKIAYPNFINSIKIDGLLLIILDKSHAGCIRGVMFLDAIFTLISSESDIIVKYSTSMTYIIYNNIGI